MIFENVEEKYWVLSKIFLGTMATTKRTKQELSTTKKEVLLTLLEASENGRLPRGMIIAIARSSCCCCRAVSKIWKTYQAELNHTCGSLSKNSVSTVAFDRAIETHKSNSGKKRIISPSHFMESLQAIPLENCQTQRDIVKQMKVSKDTLGRMIKEGYVIPTKRTVKPRLSENYKHQRLHFCLDNVGQDGYFLDMYDCIHIDECWFFVNRKTSTFYITADEDEPYTTVQNKNHLEKLHFLVALARPRYDSGRKKWFDGKIGMWPCATKGEAVRRSYLRPKGTTIWKSFNVNRTTF